MANRILIADDEKGDNSLISDILSEAGYEVVAVSTGSEALQQLLGREFDLFIVDRVMPGMGGIELLNKMREQNIALPTLMISAYGEEKLWAQAIKLGAADYILKPYKASDVLNAVKKAFGLGEKQQ